MKHIYTLCVPGGLVFLAALAVLQPDAVPKAVLPIVYAYPYVVIALGLFLGWFFDRSRIVFSILTLALAGAALVSAPSYGATTNKIVFNAVALLLPLNLLTYSVLTERGIFTPRGLARLAPLPLQVLLVWWLCQPGQRVWAVWLDFQLLGPSPTQWISLPQPAALLFGVAIAIQVVRFALYRNAFESGILWALGTTIVALTWDRSGWLSTSYLATAGLILLVALLESWYRMAYHDDLTGLPGRRALNEALLRLSGQYTIAMVDVDHFKKFNDQYGHHVGDQVLRMVASRLGEAPGGGKAFRYGGEEFAMLFPGKSLEDSFPYLEVVRKMVESSPFSLRGRGRPRKKPAKPKQRGSAKKEASVTISIGAAERDGRKDDPTKVITAADKALYRAKEGGRNQVRT